MNKTANKYSCVSRQVTLHHRPASLVKDTIKQFQPVDKDILALRDDLYSLDYN
jgi:hypothetical protein